MCSPPVRRPRRHNVQGRRADRQVDGEHASDAWLALELYLTAQKTRELPADRKAKAGSAELAAGRAVGLREGFEDRVLLALGDTDARVDDAERHDLRGGVEDLVADAPTGRGDLRDELDPALLGELY